ncbi:PKD domain-containing protein [uncultured Dokdonia sp.]|uniref:PKD domain-containing protein n=1 Tax=uncultured Dokdonia sp. TaxID=575653 RepID=UPI00262FF7BA|nr:PKD domain-containing protein [uncultured Dokdonia sp.]
MTKRFLISLLFMGVFKFVGYSQTTTQDTLTRNAPIFYDVLGNKVTYGATMPELNQIAGAPKAYYTYYWEFGDGNYSNEENPQHTYKKKGNYEARLWSTNNYANGKPPASRPKSVTITDDQNDQSSLDDGPSIKTSPFKVDEDLIIKTNRDPIPEQELVVITSYKNTKDYTTSGKLYLFYNDESFKNDNFRLKDTRIHHNETIVEEQLITANTGIDFSSEYLTSTDSSPFEKPKLSFRDSVKKTNLLNTIEECKTLYRNSQVIEFKDMQPGEERNIFRTLETTPEMIKDTSAIVTLRSVYVPDENYENHTVKDTEMEIVTSHDPNKMSSNGTLMNYRLVRFKRLKFKVRFQNDGEGPANTIRLEVDTPEMFDKKTLKVEDMYPLCRICPKGREVDYSCLDTIFKKDKIIFTFKRIYLPGTAQKNVTERDSTKGFVKYSMKFGKDFHKKKTRSRTAIYFDKNEPIYTNYSTTRFTPGISIGAKAGYIFNPNLDNAREVFAGVTISPFKSYRGYLQAELFFSASSFETLRDFEVSEVNDIGIESLTRFTEQADSQNITTYLVPISYRYNLNNFIALGTGPQLKLDLSQQCDSRTTGEFSLVIPGEGEIRDETQDTFQETKCDKGIGNFQAGWFVGANFGGARIGPSGGIRYVYNFNEPQSQVQLYGIWKF